MLQAGLGWAGQEGAGLGTGLGGSRRVWLCPLLPGPGLSARGLMLGCVSASAQRGGSFLPIYPTAWKGLAETPGGPPPNSQGSSVTVDCSGCSSPSRRRQRAPGEAACPHPDEDGEESEGDGHLGAAAPQEEMFGWRMLPLVGQEAETHEPDGCPEDCGVTRREEGQRESRLRKDCWGVDRVRLGLYQVMRFCFEAWICHSAAAGPVTHPPQASVSPLCKM